MTNIYLPCESMEATFKKQIKPEKDIKTNLQQQLKNDIETKTKKNPKLPFYVFKKDINKFF